VLVRLYRANIAKSYKILKINPLNPYIMNKVRTYSLFGFRVSENVASALTVAVWLLIIVAGLLYNAAMK
jgi:hypothetical protein